MNEEQCEKKNLDGKLQSFGREFEAFKSTYAVEKEKWCKEKEDLIAEREKLLTQVSEVCFFFFAPKLNSAKIMNRCI